MPSIIPGSRYVLNQYLLKGSVTGCPNYTSNTYLLPLYHWPSPFACVFTEDLVIEDISFPLSAG